jgi:pimeloyl-ACP methyl ester carboxylesterase
VYRLPIGLLRFLALAIFVMSTLPAHAQLQQPAIVSSDFFVPTADQVSIHVHRKVGPAPNRVPVLLIHGTWGNGGTWDFPGRSVMDRLAVRGYDVYALDLRGMGTSSNPGYANIDIFNRVNDAAAVATYIATTTGRVPVVMGWSQGGLITGLLATSHPELVAGVGLLSTAPHGFTVPTQFNDLNTDLGLLIKTLLVDHIPVPQFTPSSNEVKEIVFGTDPITGKPTISPDALATFVSPQFLQPDSVQAIFEEIQQVPPPPPAPPVSCDFFLGFGLVSACPVVPWGSINVPVLVVDGDLDPLVGENNATALFAAVGSTNKQLIIFPRNSHGWFLEDNHDANLRVVDKFLSQFDNK